MADQALLDYLDQRWNPSALLALAPNHRSPAKAQTPQRRAKRGRVAVVGDSLGVGTTPYLRKYARVKADVRVGRGSSEGVSRLKGMKGYSTLILDLGTNDMTAHQLSRSIHRAKRLARGANIVMPLVHGPGAHRKNQVIRRSGVRYVRTEKPGGDGIHYTASGYRRRARLLAREL